MKAFTVYQPYAFAIVAGLKHYEMQEQLLISMQLRLLMLMAKLLQSISQ